MLIQLFGFIISISFKFFIALLLIRSWMIAFRLPFHHPLGEFIRVCTGWLTKPFEGKSLNHTRFVIIPLILAWALQFILLELIIYLASPHLFNMVSHGHIALLATTELLSMGVSIAIAAIIIQAILSWVNPMAPMMGFLMHFTNPILRPLRRVIPLIGSIDITPMIAILICFILLRVLKGWFASIFLEVVPFIGL